VFFPQHPQVSFGTLRAFGHLAHGGADFGEAMVTAPRITAGGYERRHDESVHCFREAAARSRLEATWVSTATAGNLLSR
jgi:hypothetical protein